MLRWLLSSFRNLFRREVVEQELDSELRAYLALLTQENSERGMPEEEARRAAILQMEGMQQVKERIRDVRAGAFLDTVAQDVRYAVRVLRNSPSFFAVAVVTLALGVGVMTALFSIVDAVLLKALPFPKPERLAWIAEMTEIGHPMAASYPDLQDWRQQSRCFEAIAGYGDDDAALSTGDTAVRVHFALVTQDFFKVLGIWPAKGRDFSPEEHRPGAAPLVVISDRLWRGLLGSDPHVIGRTVKLMGGIPATVIGVMPSGFAFPSETEVWTQAEIFNEGLTSRTAHNFWVIGRLTRNRSLRQGAEELGAMSRRIKREFPSAYQAADAEAIPLQEHLEGSIKPALLTLFAAVSLVLLIVCVNIASLLLARGAARSKELAVRCALGAGRGRLVRQLSVESLILGAAGGTGGLLLAFWTVRLIKLFVPANVPRIETAGLDWTVVLFAACVSFGAALLFGAAPAWSAAQVDVNDAVKEVSQQHTGSRSLRRNGSVLVTSEIALAFMLLVSAGLLVRSFARLRSEKAGFDPRNVLTADLQFPMASLDAKSPPNYVPEYEAIASAVRELAGVNTVAFGWDLPLNGDRRDGHFWVEGQADLPGMTSDAYYRVISPAYFRVIGVALREGRFFSENDGTNTEPVAIINRTMAKQVFPKSDAIGQRIWFDSFDPEKKWMRIVGVVDDFRDRSLSAPPEPFAYVLYNQHLYHLFQTYLLVKSRVDPLILAGAVRRSIRVVDKNVPVKFDTLQAVFDRSISRQRFEAQMLAAFAWLAILLAAVGIYGVLSYLVDRTQAEIGIRMALGADEWSVLCNVIRRGLRAAAFGTVFGIMGVSMIVRTLSSALYQVTVWDPVTYIGALSLLVAAVLIASYIPARRATLVDPMRALKYE